MDVTGVPKGRAAATLRKVNSFGSVKHGVVFRDASTKTSGRSSHFWMMIGGKIGPWNARPRPRPATAWRDEMVKMRGKSLLQRRLYL